MARHAPTRLAAKRLLVLAAALAAMGTVRPAPDERVAQAVHQADAGLPAEGARRNDNACERDDNASMKLCASDRWAAQDRRLNSLYRQALENAGASPARASLLKAQRAWLAYRDGECAYEGEAGAGGGSAQALYVLTCRTELTKAQADRLAATSRP